MSEPPEEHVQEVTNITGLPRHQAIILLKVCPRAFQTLIEGGSLLTILSRTLMSPSERSMNTLTMPTSHYDPESARISPVREPRASDYSIARSKYLERTRQSTW
jgi:hypothetical protein